MSRIVIELDATEDPQEWLEDVQECYGEVVGVREVRVEVDT